MSKISNQELTLQRTQPQEVELKLSIYSPSTVFACKINSIDITKNARNVPYNTVSYGAYTDVKAGMTLLVGTSAGAYDVGKVRVRSVTATQFLVAENSNIQWANGLYLTVIKFFDIVPVYPRLVKNTKHPEDQTFYKDYDIAYTDQNSKLGTLICMGPHREAELINGVASLYYTSSGTTQVGGTSLSYSWNFEGATITGTSNATPGWVTYTGAGNYLTTLTTTAGNGAVDSSYRYIIINNPGGGPLRDWTISGLQGSRDSGGYTANITIYSPIDFPLYENSPIILSTEEYYGDIPQNIGGNYPNSERIFFVGYILSNSIKYNYEQSSVEFQIGTVSEVMKASAGFPASIDNKVTPKTWYQIQNLNLLKVVYHYWKWHSTVLLTNDVEFTGADYVFSRFECDKENLFDAIATSAKSIRFSTLTCDRNGKLWVEIDPAATPNAITSFPPQFNVTNDDWIGEPSIKENLHPPTAYLELGGVKYLSGGQDASYAYLSCAPGPTPNIRGKYDALNGLSVESQAQLNTLCGDLFAFYNAKYPSISMELAGTRKNLDLAPAQSVSINISPSDTARGVRISGSYYPSSITWDYNHEHRYLKSSVELSVITDGVDGETLLFPTGTPPINKPKVPATIPYPPGGGYFNPWTYTPPLPAQWIPEPVIPGGDPNPDDGVHYYPPINGVLFVLMGGNVYYTENFAEVGVGNTGTILFPLLFKSAMLGELESKKGLITSFDVNGSGQMVLGIESVRDGSNGNTQWGEIFTGHYAGGKSMVMGKAFIREHFPYDPFSPFAGGMGVSAGPVAIDPWSSQWACVLQGDFTVQYGGFVGGSGGEPYLQHPWGYHRPNSGIPGGCGYPGELSRVPFGWALLYRGWYLDGHYQILTSNGSQLGENVGVPYPVASNGYIQRNGTEGDTHIYSWNSDRDVIYGSNMEFTNVNLYGSDIEQTGLFIMDRYGRRALAANTNTWVEGGLNFGLNGKVKNVTGFMDRWVGSNGSDTLTTTFDSGATWHSIMAGIITAANEIGGDVRDITRLRYIP